MSHFRRPRFAGLILNFVSAGFFILTAVSAHAWRLPGDLKNSDLNEVTQIVGYGSSTKFLSNPYPLGGHSGFEVGITSEFIDTTDLARLGSGNGDETSLEYNRISIGKGLYHNVDVYIDFVPFVNSNEISEYGGMAKWAFYEADSLPLTLSALLHYDSFNIDDEFINQTLGTDLMAGWNLKNYALYFGGGVLYGSNKFMNTILDMSDPANQAANPTGSPNDPNGYLKENGKRDHFFLGMDVELSPYFISAQIDSYQETVYSLKLGYRL